MESLYNVRKEGFEIVVIDTNDNLAVETNTIVPNLNLYLFLNSSSRLPLQVCLSSGGLS